jgi:hypothetical protein
MFDLDAPEFREGCVQKCVDIISNMEKWEMKEQLKKPGAVLVFLPGIRERGPIISVPPHTRFWRVII